MLRDITIGQYYSADSLIHRLDPRVKLRFVIVYIIMSLIDRNIFLFALLTAVLTAAGLLSEVPLRYIIRGSGRLVVFILICSAVNLFTTYGETLIRLGGLTVTDAGLIKTGFVFWRMLLIIFMSSLLMYTTTPTELTDGMEKCFHLSGGTAMIITIALRFLSVLSDEMSRIMRAHEARGADFKGGGPVKRIKRLSAVIIPLFQNSVDRAANLGDAMDARCYTGGSGRTKLNPLKYEARDFYTYLILAAFIFLAVWLALKF